MINREQIARLLGAAIARCFVRRVDFGSTTPTESLTAARRTDCSPLHR